MNGIFKNTQQALHVSFLVTSLPPRQKQQFGLALIQILESVGRLSARQAEFLDYLYGSSSGTINFDGLNGDEIRAQCAMVVAAVRDHLLKPERNAIWLRYACGMPARPRATQKSSGISMSSDRATAGTLTMLSILTAAASASLTTMR